MSRGLIVVAVLLAIARSSHADPADVPAPDQVSPYAALGLSAAGTAAGWGVALAADDNAALWWIGAAGIVVGPSAGQLYAGDLRSAVIHGGVRVGAGTLVVLGIVTCGVTEGAIAAGQIFADPDAPPPEDPGDPCSEADAIRNVGVAALAISSLYSLLTAPESARLANARARTGLAVAPLVLDTRGAGLAVSGQF